jgi:hypothetical protein
MRVTQFAAAAALLVGVGFAWGGPATAGDVAFVEYVDGYPKDFHKGEDASYAVFHKKDAGWHLIVTSAGHRHHFKGRVWIEGEGKFGKVEQWKGEGERIVEAEEGNWFHKAVKRHENDREITFDIVEERRQEAGIFFNVEGPGVLKWELGIGGSRDGDVCEVSARRIKIGHEGRNPPEPIFITRAHPEERPREVPFVEYVDGYPRDFHRGEDASFAVFHKAEAGWHIVVTSAGRRHHFKGRIWIEGEGKFGKVEQWKGEGERIVEAEEGNWFHKAVKRHENDRELSFDIVEERKQEAGIFFKVEGDGVLKWELGVGGAKDGDPIELKAERIKIGHEGRAPGEVPFATYAHPDERERRRDRDR